MASDAGPVVDSDGRAHRQEFGIAAFVAPHLTVTGHTNDFVHGEFTDHAVWAVADRPRVAHAIRMFDHTAADRPARIVTVVHLHGLRDRAGKHDTPARAAQAQRLAALVERARGSGDLTVVCGDLNLLPDSETFRVLGDVGLTDLVGTGEHPHLEVHEAVTPRELPPRLRPRRGDGLHRPRHPRSLRPPPPRRLPLTATNMMRANDRSHVGGTRLGENRIPTVPR